MLTDVGGTLYFTADDGANGRELWRSDGTSDGTTMVADVNPGGGSAPDFLTGAAGTLYFRADDGTDGIELWRSDGTSTTLVKDTTKAATRFPTTSSTSGGPCTSQRTTAPTAPSCGSLTAPRREQHSRKTSAGALRDLSQPT